MRSENFSPSGEHVSLSQAMAGVEFTGAANCVRTRTLREMPACSSAGAAWKALPRHHVVRTTHPRVSPVSERLALLLKICPSLPFRHRCSVLPPPDELLRPVLPLPLPISAKQKGPWLLDLLSWNWSPSCVHLKPDLRSYRLISMQDPVCLPSSCT